MIRLLRALILGLSFILGMRELSLMYQHSIDTQWKYAKLQEAETLHTTRRDISPHRD